MTKWILSKDGGSLINAEKIIYVDNSFGSDKENLYVVTVSLEKGEKMKLRFKTAKESEEEFLYLVKQILGLPVLEEQNISELATTQAEKQHTQLPTLESFRK